MVRTRLRLEALEDRLVPALSGSSFTVNTNLVNNQTQSASASDYKGDSVVVWNDQGTIKAQRFDVVGARQDGGELNVTSGTSNNSEPAVAMDSQGDFVVTWTETETDGTQRVLAQRYGLVPRQYFTGVEAVGSVITIAAGPGITDHEARVAMDRNGDFVVSYTSGYAVRAGMWYYDGTLNRDFAVSSGPSPAHASSIACAPDGGFALAYQTDDTSSLPHSSIYLVQYDANGAAQHTEVFGHDYDHSLEAMAPSVGVDDQGNFVLAGLFKNIWATSWNLSTFEGGRFADHSSAALIATGSMDQAPAVAVDPYNGYYAVAYKEFASGGSQAFVTESAPAGQTTYPLDSAQDGSNLAVTVNTYGRYLVTYTSPDWGQPSGSDIIGQVGELSGLPGFPVSLSLGDKTLTVNEASTVSNTISISYGPSASPSLSNVTVVLNNQTFDLSDVDVSHGISVNGGSGTDTLTLHDRYASHTSSLSPGTVTSPDAPTITYNGMSALTMYGSEGSTYNVYRSIAATPITIYVPGNATNTVNVGSAPSSTSPGTPLDAIQGAVTVTGQGGPHNVLNVYDQAAAAGHIYTVTSTSLTRDGAARLTFGALASVNLSAGSHNDALVLQSLPALVTMNLDLGQGHNTVYGPNTPNTWLIDGYSNGGGQAVLNGSCTIDGITSIVGGTAPDRFVFTQSGSLPSLTGKAVLTQVGYIPASINGGGGGDTLDYSQYDALNNTGVTVNLGAYGNGTYGYATRVGTSVSNIQNVIGSRFNDILSGSIYGSVLDGLGGNDTLTAYSSGGRSVLIGGAGSDMLRGNAAGDIFIGGSTAWDSNPANLAAAMNAIFAEWNSADTFTQRQAYLRGPRGHYNGSTFLIPPGSTGQTVFDDGVKDNVMGGGGLDWNIPS
jgi:hypothetical protein